MSAAVAIALPPPGVGPPPLKKRWLCSSYGGGAPPAQGDWRRPPATPAGGGGVAYDGGYTGGRADAGGDLWRSGDGRDGQGGWEGLDPNTRCYFDALGYCKKGASCNFRHGDDAQSEGRGTPSRGAWEAKPPCALYQLGCCWFPQTCWYAHVTAKPESGLKLALCADFTRSGTCSAGEACPDAHGRDELQTPRVYEGMPGYKACLCSYFLAGECRDEMCFDAHGELEVRRVPAAAPRSLSRRDGAGGEKFAFSDSHVHLDHVLLTRKYGNYWFYKHQRCKRLPCIFDRGCMFVHPEELRVERPIARADFEELAAEIQAVPGCEFVGCVHSCCDVDEIEMALRLVEWGREVLDGKVYVSFGIHPTNFEDFTPEVEELLKAALERSGPQGVAWGECGLDYYRRKGDIEEDPSVRDRMKAAFSRQARIAVRRGLPLVVHSRDAEADTLEVLRRQVPPTHPIHLHSFMGSLEVLEEFLSSFSGGCVGVAGAVSYCPFPEAEGPLFDIARAVPLDRLLLETDGPYMAPNPYRGEESHPGRIPWIADALAQVRGVPADRILAAAHANFRRLYGV